MARTALFLCLLHLMAAVDPAAAQSPAPDEKLRTAPADSAAHLPPEAPRSGWLYVLPVLGYSPETRFMFGASAGRYYRFSDDPDARPTTVSPVALVTTANQIILGLFTDAWWAQDRWHLRSDLGYSKFPTRFYGIGDDTPESAEEDYTPRTTYLTLETTRTVAWSFNLGLRLDVRHVGLSDLADGGALASGNIPGASGSDLRGLGAVMGWDSRDAVFYPVRGWFARLAVTRYLDVLGGNSVYTLTDVGISHYHTLGDRTVLAVNLSGAFIAGGEAPFHQLNKLMLRGYFEDRYLDNHVVRAQLEARTRVWGALGAAVFTGAGEMAASLDRLRLDEARPVVGLGLRWNVGGPDTANIRLDYGWGDGDSGLYVSFGEAF